MKKKKILEKEINYYKGFLKGVEKKLSNSNFLKNAPEKVLSLEKKKKQDALKKITNLEQQLLSFG